jgi:DNA-binding XRE family transcriptional regulator
MPTFAERLQQLRDKAGLTQQQLADASGVNVWTIRGYEQGRREPNWKGAIQIAAALRVPVEAFADCVSDQDSEPPSKTRRGGTAPKKPHARPRKVR